MQIDDDWDVKEIFDPTTGEVERCYTFKRKPCIRVSLNSRLAEQLAGWTLIEKDLRNVSIWLQEIQSRHTDRPKHKSAVFGHSSDRETYNLIKGLFVAALTFYGKCYSKCEGRPVKMERSQLNKKFHEIHDVCMKYRHNFAAHSGAAKLETVSISVVFPKKPKSGVLPRIYRELFQPDLLWTSGGDGVTLLQLVEHAGEIAKEKIERLSDKILREEVLPKGYEYWKKR